MTPTKTCTRCGKVYPATPEFFHRNKNRIDGLVPACKVCELTRHTKYREEHREKRNAQRRKHYAENADEIRAHKRQYYAENAEHICENKRRWKKKNPEKIRNIRRNWEKNNRERRRELPRQYRERNHEDVLRHDREWRERNREKVRESSRRYHNNNRARAQKGKAMRRARMLNSEGTFTAADVQLIYKSQQGKCWWCGKSVGDDYHLDHRIPLAKNGTNHPENLCISCPECNRRKGAKMPWEFDGRLL